MDSLYQYVNGILKPNYADTAFINSRINSIVRVIQDNSALSLKEVIVGGSYAKGTMLRYKTDVDLVLVFNKEPGVSRNWRKLMHRVNDYLSANFPQNEIVLGENIAIHMKFQNGEKPINFDVVPSYFVNSPLQMGSVKTSKIYQGITSIWHMEYFKRKKGIPHLIDSVMLLKDWGHEHGIPLKSFHYELISASAHKWRIDNKSYTLADLVNACFSEIQGLMDGTPVFPVDWEYFDNESIKDHYDFPVLIDAANPAQNLLNEITDKQKQKIRSEATRARSFMEQGDYLCVFDPCNQTGCFSKAG